MRRLLATRGTSAAAVGVVVLLVGGGYALASGSSHTIHACVHKKGGDIYVAKKCAKHDKKITWNKVGPKGATGPKGPTGPTGATGNTGPQGPGATYLVYNASGTASPTPTSIGTIGPFTFSATCQASAGTTNEVITVSQPGVQLDGISVNGSSAIALSAALPASSGGPWDTDNSVSTTPATASNHVLVIPNSGTAVQYAETLRVTGGGTNTCHFTASATLLSAAGSSAAARRPVSRQPASSPSSGRTGRVTILGRAIG